jgi:ATP adenylyltransferase
MTANTIRLQAGTLHRAIEHRTCQAMAGGVLRPIETKCTFIDDGGVRFVVRSVSNLRRKSDDKKARQRHPDLPSNPFLPYEKPLFVTDISDTHIALLNKFNVIRHHLLIVTRHFEDQETLLTRPDLQALWACLAEFEALGFYNGGTVAGASQRHKHLQMVPLPLAPEGPAVPIEPLIALASVDKTINTLPGLPFMHACSRLDPRLSGRPDEAAAVTLERYYALLDAVGITASRSNDHLMQSAPYNLLITRSWMLLVPRSEEFFESISINALAFAGSLFVQSEEQMRAVDVVGPIRVLQRVAVKEYG